MYNNNQNMCVLFVDFYNVLNNDDFIFPGDGEMDPRNYKRFHQMITDINEYVNLKLVNTNWKLRNKYDTYREFINNETHKRYELTKIENYFHKDWSIDKYETGDVESKFNNIKKWLEDHNIDINNWKKYIILDTETNYEMDTNSKLNILLIDRYVGFSTPDRKLIEFAFHPKLLNQHDIQEYLAKSDERLNCLDAMFTYFKEN